MAVIQASSSREGIEATSPARRHPSFRGAAGAAMLAAGLALALTGCETTQTGGGAASSAQASGPIVDPPGSLAPASIPAYSVGDRYVFDAPREVWTIKGVASDEIRWSSDMGGQRVTPRDPLLPSLRTTTADVGEISREITNRTGSLWPLSVGNESNYVVNVDMQDRGAQALAWSCRVVGTDRVQVPAGTFNTYKVACARSDGLRLNTYYSPTVGYFVRREVTTAEGQTQTRSLLEVSNAAVNAARARQASQPQEPAPQAAPATPAQTAPLPPPDGGGGPSQPTAQSLPAAQPPQPMTQAAPAPQPAVQTSPATYTPAPTGPWAGAGVRLASYSSAQGADAGWSRLQASYPNLLGRLAPRVETVSLGSRGTFHRLYAGPFASAAEARGLCGRISEMGSVCDVKLFN